MGVPSYICWPVVLLFSELTIKKKEQCYYGKHWDLKFVFAELKYHDWELGPPVSACIHDLLQDILAQEDEAVNQ